MADTKAVKTVSVLMLDIQGSASLSQKVDDADYLFSLLPRFHEFIDRHIEQRIKDAENQETLGEFQKQAQHGDDCVKAVFATPRDAVACAIDLQNQFKQYPVATDQNGGEISLVLHLAVHTCPVDGDGWPARAHIPHLARLLTHANNGQILLSAACYEAYIADHQTIPFACEKFGGYLFKGVEGEQCLYSLQYDAVYRGAPGTQFIGFENLEAANEYITRADVEKAVRDKFDEAVGHNGKVRFVTIYGEGGMGKTRLSINCARQLAGRFPGSIAFVPLAGIEKPSVKAVAGVIYSALHLPKKSGEVAEQLILALKNRPKTLILLDNAETVTHKNEVIDYIQRILQDVPQVHFLASSRHWFGLGDQEGRVDINDGLVPWEAFQLFRQRAIERGFHLPENVTKDQIDENHKRLSQRADYLLPQALSIEREHDLLCLLRLFWLANYNSLAIELIASWTGKYRVAGELLANYEKDALGRLTRNAERPYGDEITRKRHDSLLSSYLWSWENLGAEKKGSEAQSAFLAACLFAETFTDEAVDAVLDWNDKDRTADATKAVQDAALIRCVISSDGTQTRYRMHWQLQAFGREEKYGKGSSEDASLFFSLTSLRQNYIDYYVEKQQEHGHETAFLRTKSRQWLGDEWRNIVAAARYADIEKDSLNALSLRLNLGMYILSSQDDFVKSAEYIMEGANTPEFEYEKIRKYIKIINTFMSFGFKEKSGRREFFDFWVSAPAKLHESFTKRPLTFICLCLALLTYIIIVVYLLILGIGWVWHFISPSILPSH